MIEEYENDNNNIIISNICTYGIMRNSKPSAQDRMLDFVCKPSIDCKLI